MTRPAPTTPPPAWMGHLIGVLLVVAVGAFFACVGYVVGTFLVGLLP